MGECGMKRVHVIYGQGDLDITCLSSISGPQDINDQPDYIQKLFEKKTTKRVTVEFETDIPGTGGFVIYSRMEKE
jgi:hypothetical protein